MFRSIYKKVTRFKYLDSNLTLKNSILKLNTIFITIHKANNQRIKNAEK